MTDKTDASTPNASAADLATGSSAPGQKRPHSTIDGRATEVKSAAVSQSASGPSSGYHNQPDRKLPPPTPPPPRRAGGFFTHLLASAAGGLIVLLGADKITPHLEKLGLPVPQNATAITTADLKTRVEAAEQSLKIAAPQDKLANAENRIASLEDGMRAIATLESEQAKLAANAEDTVDKSAFDDVAGRLKKLEDQLSTMAAAAATDKDGGNRIQGLAAVTGKLADLEQSVTGKIAEVKKGLIVEMEPKLAAVSVASEKARTGTERLDREVASLRGDTAKLLAQADLQKSDGERLEATVEAVKDKSLALTSSLAAIKGSVEKKISEAEVVSAVAPVSEKIAALESSVANVIKGEADRKASAERVVASLEMSNLKRRLDRGEPYAAELSAVADLMKGRVDLSPLEAFKDKGVASAASLQAGFTPLVNKIIDAAEAKPDGSAMERLMASAMSAVRVRKVSHDPSDTSAEAVASRIEAALKSGKLDSALDLIKGLPDKSKAVAADWIKNLEARQSVEVAMTSVEQDFKSALTGAKSGSTPPARAPEIELNTPDDNKELGTPEGPRP